MDITSALTSTSAGSGSTASTSNLSGLSGDDFMQILVKQLELQDPFKPMSNEEMVNQIANIRTLEMNTRLSTGLEQVVNQQRYGSAAALIGKYVEGTVEDADGNQFAMKGKVTGVRFTEKGEVLLELDSGDTLPMNGLSQVLDSAPAATAA